jgi:hypothetical protein
MSAGTATHGNLCTPPDSWSENAPANEIVIALGVYPTKHAANNWGLCSRSSASQPYPLHFTVPEESKILNFALWRLLILDSSILASNLKNVIFF